MAYEKNPQDIVHLKGNENRILCGVQVHLYVEGEYTYISIYVNENDKQEIINSGYLLGEGGNRG